MNLLEQRSNRNGAAIGSNAAIGALFTALIERLFVHSECVFGIQLAELRKTAALKDALADTAGSNLLGVADAAGSVLLGTTTNGGATASANESASFLFVLPQGYVAGAPIKLRARAKVSATRAVAQTVDAVAKKMGDAGLGADICATAIQTITTAYANYDFVITPTGLVAGDILQVDVFLATDDTGAAANGAASISALSMRVDTSP